MLSAYNQSMSNEAKEISAIFDNLLNHGYRALSGVNENRGIFSLMVHQNGTEIVHYDTPEFKTPVLETRPIVIAGGAGRLALTFTTFETMDEHIAIELKKRLEKQKEPRPKLQSARDTGFLVTYPSRPSILSASYMRSFPDRDYVKIEAGIDVSNLDVEPVILEAIGVGAICLVGYETRGFSQILLNTGRSLARLAL